MPKSERIAWIDSWKGLLIFLVVLGHVVGGIRFYVDQRKFDLFMYAYTFIYLFHMPSFFMAAGCLYQRRENDAWRDFFRRKGKRLLAPYFVWGCVSAAVFLLTKSFSGAITSGGERYYNAIGMDFPLWRPFVSLLHAGGWPGGEGFRCNSVLWFLPCMFVVLLLYDSIRRLLRGFIRDDGCKVVYLDAIMLVTCFAFSEIVRYYGLRFLPWKLNAVPYMMMFFLAGRLLKSFDSLLQLHVPWYLLLCGWCVYGASISMSPDILPRALTSHCWYLYKILHAIAGCFLSLYTAKMCDCALLARLGISSMGIMLVHKFFILPFQAFYGRIGECGIPSLVCAVLGIAVTVSFAAYCVARVILHFVPFALGEGNKTAKEAAERLIVVSG